MKCTLQKLQIENAEYQHQLRKFSSGTTSSASSPAVSVALSATPLNLLEWYREDFDQLGRSFCIFNELWVCRSHLCKPYPEGLRQDGPRHPKHYSNNQTKCDGIIAELYDFVPLRFHKYLEGSGFFTKKVCAHHPQTVFVLIFCVRLFKFAAGAKSMRSYIISNVHGNASDIFPVDASSKTYAVGFGRSEVPGIVALLRNPSKPAETHLRYCSVLYKDGVIAGSKIFSGTAIMNVSRPRFLDAYPLNVLIDTQGYPPRSNVGHP